MQKSLFYEYNNSICADFKSLTGNSNLHIGLYITGCIDRWIREEI